MDSVRAERETVAAGTHATVRRLRTELDTARDRRKRSATANRDWQLSVINELYEWETSKARARCDGEVASHRDGLTAQLSDQVRKDQIWNDQTCSTSSRDGVSAESGERRHGRSRRARVGVVVCSLFSFEPAPLAPRVPTGTTVAP